MSLLRISMRAARPLQTPCSNLARRYASTGPKPGARPTPPPPPPTGPPSKSTMARNAWIAGGLLTASLALWYYETKSMGVYTKEPEFTVTVGSRGNTYSFKRKPTPVLEEMLHANEKTTAPGRAGNPVARWDTNYLPCNEPCEDRSAADVVPRGAPPPSLWPSPWSWAWGSKVEVVDDEPGRRDLVMISVIDGHAGDATSQLLMKTLHPALTLSLSALESGLVPGATWYSAFLQSLSLAKLWTAPNISKSLKAAFVQLDDSICNTPIRALTNVVRAADDLEARKMFVQVAAPASAGAVAASILFDAEQEGLYVAVTGDCRAVAGWQSADGSWRCDTLTEDQMGENPKEVARMRAEHPAYESDTVIKRGRVQGGLQPTRAFGDAVYKWTTAQSEAVADVFRAEGSKARAVRPWNFTPPYVTARPEVTHRTLRQGDEKLRFVVLATDGLWDQMTSEEAALLVAGYLAHPKRPDVSKEKLAAEIPLSTTEPRPFPVQDLPGKGKKASGAWAFEGDDNAATHLIRNALGGADRKIRGELLSLHGKVARYFRDDMTVTVVFLDE